MNIFERIKRRRSVGKVTEQHPSRQQIEQLLEAATHAPNHHGVEPWKFFVVAGKARLEFGSMLAATEAARLEDPTSEKVQNKLEKVRSKPLRAPVIIIVTADAPSKDKVIALENVMAVSAAVQNMLLTADELGLTGMWRTGDGAYSPHVKRWLHLSPAEQIVGFIYIGYPARLFSPRRPESFEKKTSWLGWPE